MASQVGRFLKKEDDWALIFRHYSGNNQYFDDASDWAEAKLSNPGNPLADKFSILQETEHFFMGGKFTFKLFYPQQPSRTNIWEQTSNPVTTSESVSGYSAISIGHSENFWGGMARSNQTSTTFMDGSIDHTNWYMAVGTQSSWGGTGNYPGPGVAVNECELWVKFR